jgi:hypothetical protein
VDFGLKDVTLPLRSCQLISGGTTLAVLSDGGRKVLSVSRQLVVDSARQTIVHDSIEAAVGNHYGAPIVCPPSDDSGVSSERLWNTLDRQIALTKVGATQVSLVVRTDHSECHRGP